MAAAQQTRIGFIGAGRVGCGLALALHRAGYHIAAVSSRTRASAESLAARINSCRVEETARHLADLCDLVFVTTPDRTIADAIDDACWRAGQSVVHCSGATEVSALASAEAKGALIGGFHPMQAFADPIVAADTLADCTVTIEAKPPLDGLLSDIAGSLGCPVNRLPPGARALYHASAGYGSQFLNVLLAEAASAWRSWGATEDDVVRAFLPMMRGTLDSIEASGIAGGMPGPVSRGDVGSVEAHVQAMGAHCNDALAFYTAHCRKTVALAEAAGRIDSDTAAKILDVLG